MKKDSICKSRVAGFADPVYRYILAAAGIIFLYISLGRYTKVLYEYCLIIPCLMMLGMFRERRMGLKYWKRFLLPLAMAAWFLILQIKRSIVYDEVYNVGLFLSTYLFAFPLASILDDSDSGKALKIFAGAYLAAAAALAAGGILLVLDCLPSFLSEDICWDGARLQILWHPNIAACFLMIGVIIGTAFVSQAKSKWGRLGFGTVIAFLFVIMALTNCRTAIILTGGYLGIVFFFSVLKHGRKWFLPGILGLLAVTIVFYMGAGALYQANHDMLLKQYTQQYIHQTEAEDTKRETVAETYDHQTEAPAPTESSDHESEEKAIPIKVDPHTGEVRLITISSQGTMGKDFGTLNGRTNIWNAALFALRESRAILLWGIGNPGWYVSQYYVYKIEHAHNAWMQSLLGLGLAGFAMVVIFTLITLWNCLIVLLKHHQDIWKRSVALLALFLMAAAFLEPYLFYTTSDYHMIDFLFFLCSGYLVHWQEEDNRRILAVIRSRFPFVK